MRAARDLVRAEERFLQYAGPTPQAIGRYVDLLNAVQALGHDATIWPSSPFAGVRERVVSGCKIYYRMVPDIRDNATSGEVRVLHVRLPGQNDSAEL